MNHIRQSRLGATAIDLGWHDRDDGRAPAERAAHLSPVVRRADQELERLRQALVHAWAEIAELRVLADHDSLTGLANRRRLMTELDSVIDECGRHGSEAALVFMDLDRLKALNDSHGHQTGDAAIVHVARIIRESLRGEFAARFGGDEFALILTGVDQREAGRQAAAIADRVASSPLEGDGGVHWLSVSFGVTAIRPGTCAKTLLARADAAMYAGKRAV